MDQRWCDCRRVTASTARRSHETNLRRGLQPDLRCLPGLTPLVVRNQRKATKPTQRAVLHRNVRERSTGITRNLCRLVRRIRVLPGSWQAVSRKAQCGANPWNDIRSASASQWYNACVSGSTANAYPHRKSYDPTLCNGHDYWENSSKAATAAVGSLPSCQAAPPYAGVYDLSGNAEEWGDNRSVSTEAAASCRVQDQTSAR